MRILFVVGLIALSISLAHAQTSPATAPAAAPPTVTPPTGAVGPVSAPGSTAAPTAGNSAPTNSASSSAAASLVPAPPNAPAAQLAAPPEQAPPAAPMPQPPVPAPQPEHPANNTTAAPAPKAAPPVAEPTPNAKAELYAILRTSYGDITIRLDKEHAPLTVNHFIGLARGEKEFLDGKTSKHSKRPFYNGLTFHRVVKGVLVQTGCPFGNGRGGPGDIAMIHDEIQASMKFNRPGLVAMAPARKANGIDLEKDSNGSQFFITLMPMSDWDGKFTIFGEVEDGLEVVQKISSVKVGPTERPIKRIYLMSVDIVDSPAAFKHAAPKKASELPPTVNEQGVPAQ